LQHISQHSATGVYRDEGKSSHSDADFKRSMAGQEKDMQTGIYWSLTGIGGSR